MAQDEQQALTPEFVHDLLRDAVKEARDSQKAELREKIEGMKKEIDYEELDTGIGIDRLEYDGQENKHHYNNALADILELLK